MSKAMQPNGVEVHFVSATSPEALQDAIYEVLQTVADEAQEDGWTVCILNPLMVRAVVMPDGTAGHGVTIVTGVEPAGRSPADER